jgi:hypothetical protein
MDKHWFDIITLIMLFIFMYGLVFNEPILFIQLNFLIKVIIGIYLIYKYNDFRSHKTIQFTVLDKKICYSAGIYLLIFSFADVINSYFNKIREILKQQLKINT